MDPSALIFVALAVAWAAYLIPKALEAGDGGQGSAIGRVSARVRVLARREPVVEGFDLDDEDLAPEERKLLKAEAKAARQEARTQAKQQVRASRAASKQLKRDRRTERRVAAAQGWLEATPAARRRVAALAAARRRRILGMLVLATLVVVGLAGYGLFEWAWTAIPASLVVAWLVVCRLMVRRETAIRRTALEHRDRPRAADAAEDEERKLAVAIDPEATGELAAFLGEDLDPATEIRYDPVTGSWDPVPVQLPTYVHKERASRSVRTIDLDSTGVWSSGRSEADSALAREAEAAQAAQAAADGQRARATGS